MRHEQRAVPSCALACLQSRKPFEHTEFVPDWAQLLTFGLRGDDRALDLGYGRGALLLMAAERLTTGPPSAWIFGKEPIS
jgi:hypothetical protein